MATIKKTSVKKVAKPVAVDTAAAPAVTGTPKTKKEKVVKISKYRGATTGLRVMAFQDQTFEENYRQMRTDEELAALWRKEFPNAVAFTPGHVSGARRDFNNGTHAKATPRPDSPLAKVIMDGAKRRFVTDTEVNQDKSAKKEAKVAKIKATKIAKAS
jgi:hypothetical protein